VVQVPAQAGERRQGFEPWLIVIGRSVFARRVRHVTRRKVAWVYFRHHRELLGALSLAVYQTVRQLMAAAVEEEGFRPGMVSVIQTFGDGARFHPHAHALCSRGGWTARGEWVPLSYVDGAAAERLFRHKVLGVLRRSRLLSQERIGLLELAEDAASPSATGSSCTLAVGESSRRSAAP
jgi:hypothetical protein